MPNMSYCRFENTYPELRDCYEAMGDDVEELSPEEQKYRKRIINLCCDVAIEYGYELAETEEFGVIQAPIPSWTAKDVARYWGVTPYAVYKWVYRGRLTAHRTPGGGLRFVESEVKAASEKMEAE